METIPGITRISSSVPGPSVVIMGGVHGNEPCGVLAVERLRREFDTGRLSLAKGELLLIVANKEALESDVRQIKHNLNRLFRHGLATPACYETHRAEELKPILAKCDYLLDLHSTTSPSPPFLMCETDGLDIARLLGVERIVLGWAALGDPAFAGDTECWARSYGAKAFTLECGQHREPAAAEVAYGAALRLLSLTGVLSQSMEPAEEGRCLILKLYSSQLMEDPSFKFSRTYAGFDALEAGERIGSDIRREYRADRASYILMPVDPALTEVGKELYILAELHENT